MKDKVLPSYNINEQFDDSIDAASVLFNSNKIFIYPTDTVYGIGGNPFNKNSVKSIMAIKGRDSVKQFIWLISDLENLLNYVEIVSTSKLDFLKKIWPGPVSVVLPLNSKSKALVGYNTVAFRIPDNKFCRKLLSKIDFPLISTSANRSGQDELNNFNKIKKEFCEDVDAIFYTEIKTKSTFSTIIDLTSEKPVLIREGEVKFVELLDKFN